MSLTNPKNFDDLPIEMIYNIFDDYEFSDLVKLYLHPPNKRFYNLIHNYRNRIMEVLMNERNIILLVIGLTTKDLIDNPQLSKSTSVVEDVIKILTKYASNIKTDKSTGKTTIYLDEKDNRPSNIVINRNNQIESIIWENGGRITLRHNVNELPSRIYLKDGNIVFNWNMPNKITVRHTFNEFSVKVKEEVFTNTLTIPHNNHGPALTIYNNGTILSETWIKDNIFGVPISEIIYDQSGEIIVINKIEGYFSKDFQMPFPILSGVMHNPYYPNPQNLPPTEKITTILYDASTHHQPFSELLKVFPQLRTIGSIGVKKLIKKYEL